MFALDKCKVCSAEPHGEGSGVGGLGQPISWSSAPNAGNLPTPNPDHAAQTNSEAADFALDTAREIVLHISRQRTAEERRPIGIALNAKEDPARVTQALRSMGDYPPLDKPNSTERPGDWPAPDESFSLGAAFAWLKNAEASDTIVVYGFGGYNRYVFGEDGSVAIVELKVDQFNGLASREEAVERARELGFWVK